MCTKPTSWFPFLQERGSRRLRSASIFAGPSLVPPLPRECASQQLVLVSRFRFPEGSSPWCNVSRTLARTLCRAGELLRFDIRQRAHQILFFTATPIALEPSKHAEARGFGETLTALVRSASVLAAVRFCGICHCLPRAQFYPCHTRWLRIKNSIGKRRSENPGKTIARR